MTDLVVAGAGPAGLMTALHARAAGLDVLVVDPRTGPIDKACGEGLMPGALRSLEALGLDLEQDVPGREFRGIRYLDGDAHAEAHFRDGPGRGVRRDVLQGALARLAAERGIQRVTGRIGDVRQGADSVTSTLHTASGTSAVTADHLVAADGLHSPIRQRLGLQLPAAGPPRWGLRRHVAVAPWTDLVEVHWATGAEVYVTPVGDHEVSVAVLSGRRASFDEHLSAFPALADRLAGANADDVRGAGPLRQRVKGRVSGRVLLVGDAAGYVDALTGEGIDIAARASLRLVQCLVAGRPGDYEQAWQQVTRRYRWITGSLLAASRQQSVRRRLVGAAARLPRVFDAAVDQLTR